MRQGERKRERGVLLAEIKLAERGDLAGAAEILISRVGTPFTKGEGPPVFLADEPYDCCVVDTPPYTNRLHIRIGNYIYLRDFIIYDAALANASEFSVFVPWPFAFNDVTKNFLLLCTTVGAVTERKTIDAINDGIRQ